MMFNPPSSLSRKLLPTLIASAIAASAHGAGDEVINTAVSGTQSFLSDSTSITVTGMGSIDAYLSGSSAYDDGITLSDGGHNLTFINIEEGAVITAGWDAIYTGDEGANTIGSITVAGDLFSQGYIGGIGVSVDSDTTVTGDVVITSTGSFTGTGTDPSEGNPSLNSGVEQAGIAVIGTVNGTVRNAGTITARNGITVLGAEFPGGSFAGTVDGNLVNTGTMNVDGDGGLFVLGGGVVGGDVRNDGTINSSNGATGIRVASKVINLDNGSTEVDGFASGASAATVTGSVINTGTIIADFDGIAINDNVSIGGDVINSGTIDVSSVPDGDAAAILIGDDDDIDNGLPTIAGEIINSGTLTSDSSLELDEETQMPLAPAERIGTVVLHTDTGVDFINQTNGVIQNLDSQGNAIQSTNASDAIYNAGNIIGAVRINGGELDNDGSITGAVAMGGGTFINSGSVTGAVEMGGGSFTNNGLVSGSVNMNGGEFASDGGTSGSIIGAGSITYGINSPGVTVTTINGDLTFNGQLLVVATAEQGEGFTANGKLDVTGDADLTGATVTVGLTPGSVTAQGDEFSFVSAAGTLTADATTANGINLATNSSVVGFTVEQRGNELFAIAGTSDFGAPLDGGLSQLGLQGKKGGKNLTQVAGALNNVPLGDLDGGSRLGQAISTLQGGGLSDENYARAISTLDPDTVESTSAGSMSADTAAAGAVGSRQTALRDYYGISGAVAGDPLSIHGFWIQAYDNETDQNVKDGVDGFDADTYGFAIGLDSPLTESINVGAALSYADTDVEGKIESNKMAIESIRLAAYGSYNAESYYVDGQVAYAVNQYESDRIIDSNLTGGNQVIANGDHDGDQYSLRVRGGYPIATESNWFITPKAELDYTYLDEDSYTEKGAGNLGLEVDTDAMEVLIAGIGVTFAYPITTSNDITWIPEFSVDYMYDFIGDEVEVDSNFIGVSGAGFITNGASNEQEMYKMSLRLRAFGQGNFSFSGGFDYIEKQDYESQSLMATVRYDF